MIKQVLFLFSLTLLFSCSVFNKGKKNDQLSYIPKAFQSTYLGMPLAKFKEVSKNATLSSDEDFRTVYQEEFTEGDIKKAVYYFGKKGDLPLYEYIFDYYSKEKRDEFVAANLGDPNNGEEWLIESNKGFKIKAWTFKNKLVVTGLIKDTEWYEDENKD